VVARFIPSWEKAGKVAPAPEFDSNGLAVTAT
jgi:hypothetical protein